MRSPGSSTARVHYLRVTVVQGMQLRRGRVHVAPPDHHLLVVDGAVHLSHGPTGNGHRPAVDGTAGMLAIAARGGLTVVQEPSDALCDGMPTSVLRHLAGDHVLPPKKMGALLKDCVGLKVDALEAPPDLVDHETAIAAAGGGVQADEVDASGTTSNYSCPDREGTLVELDAMPKRFRCQVGHAWAAEALLDGQSVAWGMAV